MRDDIAPEEKLLRLIKGQKKPGVGLTRESPALITDLKTTAKPSIKSSFQKYAYFLNARRIIFIAFVASCIYLAVSLIYPWIIPREIKLPQIPPEKIIEPKVEPGQGPRPYEFYLEGIRNRQVFSASTQETERPASGVNVDLMKDMSLVGIISGENPQAVIEDTKMHKTYYATKGQFIGEFQVEDIQEGKIILNYRGQRFELYI